MAEPFGNDFDIFVVGTSPDIESVLQIVSLREPDHLVNVHFENRVDCTFTAHGGKSIYTLYEVTPRFFLCALVFNSNILSKKDANNDR